jgi:PAS domain S-box-containing protein
MPKELANAILENIGDGVLSVDASLKIVFANRTACSIIGLPQSTVIGSHVDEVLSLVIYDDRCNGTIIDPIREVFASGETTTYAEPMVVSSVKDRMVYVEDTTSPIKNSDGKVIGVIMVFREITERVQLEMMLKMSNSRYRMLFDHSKHGVAIYGSRDGENFEIVDFNPAAEKIEWSINGFEHDKAFKISLIPKLLETFKKVWKTGVPENMEPFSCEDGERKVWRDDYVYKLSNGEIVTVYSDVTQKRNRAESISDSIGKLRDNHHALARANGILSIEGALARSIASGTEGGLDAILKIAGKKMKLRWLCVVLVSESGIMGKWADEIGSSVVPIDANIKFNAKDTMDVKKWVMEKQTYIGDREGLPTCLFKMTMPFGGHWMAVPVFSDKPYNLVGVVMMSSQNGKKWSQDECSAMDGLATMFCILAKEEKNRNELSRKIEETISNIERTVMMTSER